MRTMPTWWQLLAGYPQGLLHKTLIAAQEQRSSDIESDMLETHRILKNSAKYLEMALNSEAGMHKKIPIAELLNNRKKTA